MTPLPVGWSWATLDDLQADERAAITDGPFGSHLTSAHYSDSGPRVVRLQNIGDGVFHDARAHISSHHFEQLRRHEVKPGDLLVASLGERLPRSCLAPATLGPAIVKADCIRVRLHDRVEPRWVLYAMQTSAMRAYAADQLHGVGRPRLGLKVIRSLPIPLPPLDEQRRLVDLLEDHLSRLDHAGQSLTGAEQRAASLSASSAARLITAGAGEACTEARFGSATAAIPAHWRMSTVGDEAALVQYGTGGKTGPARDADDVPVLRMSNVKRGRVQLNDLKYLPPAHPDLERLLLDPGDLLFNRTNSAEHVGKSAVFKGVSGTTSFASYLIRVRLNSDVDPNWANLVINSSFGRAFVSSVVSQQVGQANVNGTKLKVFPLPVPPRAEQERLVAQHDEAVEAGLRVAAFVRDNLQRSLALRRSLLDAAFSGRL